MQHFNTIVLGLGAMGAATAWACVQRGQSVLGLEQFSLVHTLGSSHGHSRIIREVYYEHPAYVPMAQEAFRHWELIEEQAKEKLLTRCRCANIGTTHSEIIQGVLLAAHQHALPIERWSAQELRRSMPALEVPDDMQAVVEERAGWLAVEKCVQSMLQLAEQRGATLHKKERVISWRSLQHWIEVTTDRDRYAANKLVITAGPWASQLLTELDLPLSLMRQMQLWFKPHQENTQLFGMDRFPIFIMDTPAGHFYGIPQEAGPGVKIAQHYGAPELLDPGQIELDFKEDDLEAIRPFLRNYVPALSEAPLAASASCIYTLTPDRHFVIGLHPEWSNVAIACGFSGHGFKFAPVIGEMLADLLEGRSCRQTQQLFALNRFAK